MKRSELGYGLKFAYEHQPEYVLMSCRDGEEKQIGVNASSPCWAEYNWDKEVYLVDPLSPLGKNLGPAAKWRGAMLPLSTPLVEDTGKYLLWNPASRTPPTKIMTSKKQAYAVAEKMAEQEPGHKFYVAQLLDIIEVEVVKTKKVSKP